MKVFVSTIIPTVGRDTLTCAVQSVLDQQFDKAGFEVIVVNDSGNILSQAEWQDALNVKIINTNRRERSVARNAGAAIATGQYLHFLDDDDWILPGTFEHFWELAQQNQMSMMYGGYQFVNSNGRVIEECHPDESGNCFIRFMSGEWQPLQASLFDSKTFHVHGGFTALDVLRGGDEDVDLMRRISLEHDIAGIQELVAVIRIDRNKSTTNYSNLQEQSRQSRDLILGRPGAFSRLRESARGRRRGSGYWHGRMIWIYLGSVLWNIRQGKIAIALSRLAYLGAAFTVSFRFWLFPGFWRGSTRGHQAKGWLVSEK
jgi:glycosyltransferase involved in cell wall biosynthesis